MVRVFPRNTPEILGNFGRHRGHHSSRFPRVDPDGCGAVGCGNRSASRPRDRNPNHALRDPAHGRRTSEVQMNRHRIVAVFLFKVEIPNRWDKIY